MARTVADLAMLLSIQAGYDARLPLSIDGDGTRFQEPLKIDLKGKRIAWAGDFKGYLPFEPGVLDVCKAALKTFESMGCIVEEAQPNYPVDAVWRAWLQLRAWQAGLAAIRRTITLGGGMSFEDGMAFELETATALADAADFAEGVDAFLNKRAPQWAQN